MQNKDLKGVAKMLKRPYRRDIMGVYIDSTQMNEVLERIVLLIDKKEKFYVVTPNPEIILAAKRDERLRNIINSSDFSVPDGIGVIAVDKYLSLRSPKNKILKLPMLILQGMYIGISVLVNRGWLEKDMKLIKGRQLFLELCRIANEKHWKVYLLGGEGNVPGITSSKIKKKYKNIILKYSGGPVLGENGKASTKKDRDLERSVIKEINRFKPQMLFVAFGAPKQEKWIERNINSLDVGGTMVVGGAFDYISGKSRLPYKILEDLGLEWLWRMFCEPRRVRRVFVAFPTFPILVFWHKFVSE